MTDLEQKDFEDFVSMAYAVHCLIEGQNIEPDFAKPAQTFQFPQRSPIFEALIHAVQAGQIECRGRFADVCLDLPALEGDIEHEDVVQSCYAWRARGDIRIAFGQEDAFSEVPPYAWWNEGAIWELSALWIGEQSRLEVRRENLNIERTLPTVPERPYDFEQILCFLDVKFRLTDIKNWSRARSRTSGFLKRLNPRGAGMKPQEDYEAITDRLKGLVNDGKVWLSWMDVWLDVRDLFKNPDSDEASEQPYKKLQKRLQKYEPDFLEVLRSRIDTVKRRTR